MWFNTIGKRRGRPKKGSQAKVEKPKETEKPKVPEIGMIPCTFFKKRTLQNSIDCDIYCYNKMLLIVEVLSGNMYSLITML